VCCKAWRGSICPPDSNGSDARRTMLPVELRLPITAKRYAYRFSVTCFCLESRQSSQRYSSATGHWHSAQTASEHHNAGGHAAEPNVFSPLYVMSGKLREASAKCSRRGTQGKNPHRNPSLSLCSSYTLLMRAARKAFVAGNVSEDGRLRAATESTASPVAYANALRRERQPLQPLKLAHRWAAAHCW